MYSLFDTSSRLWVVALVAVACVETPPPCVGEACDTECPAGLADCDGVGTNGCEADLSSVASCGACGNACTSTQVCEAGACVAVTCEEGLATCDGDVPCAVSIATDPSNCGACGETCDGTDLNLVHECRDGQCAIVGCVPGAIDCDGDLSNGCDTLDSRRHCGACDRACDGARDCVDGACELLTCEQLADPAFDWPPGVPQEEFTCCDDWWCHSLRVEPGTAFGAWESHPIGGAEGFRGPPKLPPPSPLPPTGTPADDALDFQGPFAFRWELATQRWSIVGVACRGYRAPGHAHVAGEEWSCRADRTRTWACLRDGWYYFFDPRWRTLVVRAGPSATEPAPTFEASNPGLYGSTGPFGASWYCGSGSTPYCYEAPASLQGPWVLRSIVCEGGTPFLTKGDAPPW